MNAWDVSDDQLKRMLNAWVSVNTSKIYNASLFQNDYTPVPGTYTGSFVIASYPGYLSLTFPISSFGAASVTDHIASITSSTTLTFAAASSGSFSQMVYGYAVFDDLWNYAWCERFETPYTMTAGAKITINPRFKTQTCAGLMMARRRRSRAAVR